MLKFIRLLFALPFLSIASLGWAQTAQKIEGTSVSIVAPDGFTAASSFSGLQNIETGSSIMIVEMPATAYEEMNAIFGDEKQATAQLATRGVNVSGVSTIEVDGVASPFVIGKQSALGKDVDKYLVLSKHGKTIMINFNIMGGLSKNDVVKTIASIEVSAPPSTVDKLAALPFSVDTQAPFIHADTFSGAAVLKSFEDIDRSGLKPMIIIAPSVISIDLSDLETVAENAIAQTAYFGSAKIKGHSEIVIDGKKSIKTTAKQDKLMLFHYVFPTSDSGYLRMIAKGNKSEMKNLETVVDEIAKSIAVK